MVVVWSWLHGDRGPSREGGGFSEVPLASGPFPPATPCFSPRGRPEPQAGWGVGVRGALCSREGGVRAEGRWAGHARSPLRRPFG